MGAGIDDGRRWLIGTVAVLAAGGAILALRGGVPEPVPEPTPVPSPVLSTYESPPPVPTESAAPPTALAYAGLCGVTTDRRSTLRVAFRLVNTTAGPVTLVAVSPRLPLPRLRPGRVDVRIGDCGRTGALPADRVVPGRGELVVTMELGLPAECPKPYPVEAAVTERSPAGARTGEVRLLNDLGRFDFDTCTD